MAIQINELLIKADLSDSRKAEEDKTDRSKDGEGELEKRMRANLVFKQFKRKER
jgi:hypothetical protein